jgi:hypothetical protein
MDELLPLARDTVEMVSKLYISGDQFFGTVIWQSIVFVVGIYCFTIFTGFFLERLSRKEVLYLENSKNPLISDSYSDHTFKIIFRYFIKNLVFFPLMAVVLTAITTIFLIIMSKNQPANTIAAISVAIIIVIRILAYTNEKLGIEVAKMLPFALLTVVLTDPSTFAQDDLIIRINQLRHISTSVLPLFFVFIVAELIIQPLLKMKQMFSQTEEEKEKNREREWGL